MDSERTALVEALKRVALSRPNDAVALAQNPRQTQTDTLDLWCVSEFKLSSTGSVEIKFFDRVRALGLLLEHAGSGEDGLGALLKALEGAEE